MNISSSRQSIKLDRGKAKKAYQKATNRKSVAEKTHFQSIEDNVALSNKRALQVGLASGVGISGLTAFAAHQMGTLFSGDGQAIISVVMIGAVLGIGIAGGTQAYVQHQGSKERDTTTLPELQESREAHVVARENYRNSLLQELDDEGVVGATQAKWEELKKAEITAPNLGKFRKTHQQLATQLGHLESLADARQKDGWVKKMAHLEDNPVAFSQQMDAVKAHPTLQKMVQCNN